MPKLQYSISEVAQMLGVSQSLLRFWESELADMPGFMCQRNSRGTRKYSAEQVENCRLLKYYIKEKKLTIAGAKAAIRSGRSRKCPSVSLDQVISRLLKIRDEAVFKIRVYDNIIRRTDPISRAIRSNSGMLNVNHGLGAILSAEAGGAGGHDSEPALNPAGDPSSNAGGPGSPDPEPFGGAGDFDASDVSDDGPGAGYGDNSNNSSF